MNKWIKLSPAQLSQLEALSDTNSTNNFIAPVADVDGVYWLASDVLTEKAGLFSHYAPLLNQFSDAAASVTEPDWPEAD